MYVHHYDIIVNNLKVNVQQNRQLAKQDVSLLNIRHSVT